MTCVIKLIPKQFNNKQANARKGQEAIENFCMNNGRQPAAILLLVYQCATLITRISCWQNIH